MYRDLGIDRIADDTMMRARWSNQRAFCMEGRPTAAVPAGAKALQGSVRREEGRLDLRRVVGLDQRKAVRAQVSLAIFVLSDVKQVTSAGRFWGYPECSRPVSVRTDQ